MDCSRRIGKRDRPYPVSRKKRKQKTESEKRIMENQLFTGELTRLVAFDPERAAELLARWNQDTEFSRDYDFPPVRPRDAKRTQARLTEQPARVPASTMQFHIAVLEDARIIGECELEMNSVASGEAYAAIGIGERAYWGKGFGTDAMQLLLGFGFREWNLHRVSLVVFGYNPRALRAYEKCGFRAEGRLRNQLARGGERYDSIVMGILREEWKNANRA